MPVGFNWECFIFPQIMSSKIPHTLMYLSASLNGSKVIDKNVKTACNFF